MKTIPNIGVVFILKRILIAGHADRINAVTFDTESKSIVSCAKDKVLNVVDIQTSTQIYCTTLEHESTCLAWIGEFLVIGDSAGFINVWNLQSALCFVKIQCHDGKLLFISVNCIYCFRVYHKFHLTLHLRISDFTSMRIKFIECS